MTPGQQAPVRRIVGRQHLTRPAAALGLLVGVGALAHVSPGITTLRSWRCRFLPRLSGVGDAGHVALTFDDGPDPESTPAFLDALDAHGWRATFFMLGEQVARDPDLAAEVLRRGHELGVHGYRHSNHLRRSVRWTTNDLRRAITTIEDATGETPRWFRPPYGALAASSVLSAHHCDLPTVLWTTWGRDWRPDATAETVVADIVDTWHPGATILLHDSDITSAAGAWKAPLDALPELAERWSSAGLRVGPLGEHGLHERRRGRGGPHA